MNKTFLIKISLYVCGVEYFEYFDNFERFCLSTLVPPTQLYLRINITMCVCETIWIPNPISHLLTPNYYKHMHRICLRWQNACCVVIRMVNSMLTQFVLSYLHRKPHRPGKRCYKSFQIKIQTPSAITRPEIKHWWS